MRLILSLMLASVAVAHANAANMKTIVVHEYGGPEVLKYEDAPTRGKIVVKMADEPKSPVGGDAHLD